MTLTEQIAKLEEITKELRALRDNSFDKGFYGSVIAYVESAGRVLTENKNLSKTYREYQLIHALEKIADQALIDGLRPDEYAVKILRDIGVGKNDKVSHT